MPLKIGTPLIKEFDLEKSDPKKGTQVTFRQATQLQHDMISDLFAESTYVYDEQQRGTVQQKVSYNRNSVMRHAIRLTMMKCNIEGPDGNPLFKSKVNEAGQPVIDMDDTAFYQAYGLLPLGVAEEMFSKVIELNPAWGGRAGE